MSTRPTQITGALHDYLLAVSLREADILRQLREETAQHPLARMQIAPEQGQLIAFLIQLLGARRTLEIGVFTGYSSLAVALALPPEGRIVACDVSDEYTEIARRFWRAADVEHKIELHLAPALATLDRLLEEGGEACFDFAFIDADKASYDAYYERSLRLVRRGGVIAIDNVLWDGRVADPAAQDEDTLAIRALNAKLRQDERIALSLVPVADGMSLALKL